MDGRTDGWTDGCKDRQSDTLTDRYIERKQNKSDLNINTKTVTMS